MCLVVRLVVFVGTSVNFISCEDSVSSLRENCWKVSRNHLENLFSFMLNCGKMDYGAVKTARQPTKILIISGASSLVALRITVRLPLK